MDGAVLIADQGEDQGSGVHKFPGGGDPVAVDGIVDGDEMAIILHSGDGGDSGEEGIVVVGAVHILFLHIDPALGDGAVGQGDAEVILKDLLELFDGHGLDVHFTPEALFDQIAFRFGGEVIPASVPEAAVEQKLQINFGRIFNDTA